MRSSFNFLNTLIPANRFLTKSIPGSFIRLNAMMENNGRRAWSIGTMISGK